LNESQFVDLKYDLVNDIVQYSAATPRILPEWNLPQFTSAPFRVSAILQMELHCL